MVECNDLVGCGCTRKSHYLIRGPNNGPTTASNGNNVPTKASNKAAASEYLVVVIKPNGGMIIDDEDFLTGDIGDTMFYVKKGQSFYPPYSHNP